MAFDRKDAIAWKKSSWSNHGNCVEVAFRSEDGRVLVRDSKNPGGGSLSFSATVWQEFTASFTGE